MNFARLAKTAKRIVDKRGGVEALKADAEELKKIAKSEASIGTKAGAAVKAIKDAGAKDPEQAAGETVGGEQPAGAPAEAPAATTPPAPPAAEPPGPPAAATGDATPPAG
jgi:hypothetical protein